MKLKICPVLLRIAVLLLAMPVSFPALAEKPPAASSSTSQVTHRAGCKTIQNESIVIECTYRLARTLPRPDRCQPAIALNRFKASFDAGDEGPMEVEVTFTNTGKKPIADQWKLFITVDDSSARNYLRRPLPGVDLRTLAPKKSRTFSEQFLAGALRPGLYIFHLWIVPANAVPPIERDHTLLLINGQIADAKAGMNTLADFQIGTR